MTPWHHGAMTSWRHDTSTSWHNDTRAPWHQDLSTRWHCDTIIRWHHDSIRLWHCDSMTKWHHDTTSKNSWGNRMGKFDTMTFWRQWSAVKIPLKSAKCPNRQYILSYGFTDNVRWNWPWSLWSHYYPSHRSWKVNSYIRHKIFLCVSAPFATLTAPIPPLDSEMGWTGEFWTKTFQKLQK